MREVVALHSPQMPNTSNFVPQTIKLNDAAWRELNEMLDRPAAAHPALVELFSERDPFRHTNPCPGSCDGNR